MRRGLLILLALLVVTWFEFQVYPGHSYLHGETQLLVPMLERLDTPGFLSRDLVASNPNFAYTIYDEITQALHSVAHMSFEEALRRQQIFFRLVAIVGVYLCARALQVAPAVGVVLSGCINAITSLAAPAAFVTSREATPAAFAVALTLLAVGLLMNHHTLLAGLAGGCALLYEPVIAAAFWLVVMAAWLGNPPLRRVLRPLWPVLIIFLLLLGNLVQLQSGLGSGQELTGTLSGAIIALTKLRTPWVWPSLWLRAEIWSYLFLLVTGGWALARMWKQLDSLVRWSVIALAFSGPFSVAVALLLLAAGAQPATWMAPSRNLVFSVVMVILVCGAAAAIALHKRAWREGILWSGMVIAAILNAQVLNLLHLQPALPARDERSMEVSELAAWAEQKTWGSSMFQFPDAGYESEPGIFRALSRRALWADWGSGVIADYSGKAGLEWWSRWNTTIQAAYSVDRLQGMLALPIDYYVLHRRNRLTGVPPVYANEKYLVYDAQDLRQARRPLH